MDVLVDVDPSIGLRFVALADEIERMVGLRAEVVSRRAIGSRMMAAIAGDLIDVG